MRRLLCWLVAAILILQCAAVAARPYSLDDLLRHEDTGRMLVDPGGRWLLFEKYESHLAMQRQDRLSLGQILRARPYIVDLHGRGPARPLLDDGQPGTILLGFSPSGKRVAVARLQDGAYRFGIVLLASGAVQWWSYAPVHDGFHPVHSWLSDDRLLILTQRDDRPAVRMALDWPPERPMRERWDRTAAGALALSVSGSGRYLRDDGRSQQQLLMVDAVTGATQALATGPFAQLQLSPDGKYVALIKADRARQPSADQMVGEDDSFYGRHLLLLDLASGAQWEPCSECSLPGDPRWSDDSAHIGFVADRKGRREAVMANMARHVVMSASPSRSASSDGCVLAPHQDVPVAARASVTPTEERASFSVPMPCTRPSAMPGTIWAAAPWRVGTGGVIVERPTGGAIRIPWQRHEAIASVQSSDMGKGGAVALRISAASGRSDLFLAGEGQARFLMALNSVMRDVEPAIMRPLLHPSADGSPVTSWLVLPPGEKEAKGLPMVVIPYPGQIYSDVAPADQQVGRERFYTNAQLLAASGFTVLLPSIPMPRVLPDTGFDFPAALAPAIEAALATGACDPARIALWGHSYGAYSVAMAAAQSRRFRAVVASAGIYDLAATAGTFGRAMRLSPEEGLNVAASYAWAENGQGRMGVAPWKAPGRYIANSPIYQADRVNVPMLIIGADRDFSPVEQGEQLFSALFRQGKDAQLITYWGEGHVIGSPANLRDFYARVIGFLADNLAVKARAVPVVAAAAPAIPASSARQ